jgi:hypothetical protein
MTMEPTFETIPDRSAPEYTRPPTEAYEGGGNQSYRRHQAVNHVITERLLDRITGRGETERVLYGVDPRTRCFAAALSSQERYRESMATEGESEAGTDEEDEDAGAGSRMLSNIAPFSTGLKLIVDPDELEGSLRLEPQLRLYRRRFPTYEEQLEHSDLAAASEEEDELPDAEEEMRADGGAGIADSQSLVMVHERIDPELDGLEIHRDELLEAAADEGSLTHTLTELDSLAERTMAEDRAMREPREGSSYRDIENVPAEALADAEAFEQHIDTVFTDEPREPLWSAELRVEAEERDDGRLDVTTSLFNTHGEDVRSATEAESNWQSFLFDAGLRTTVEGGSLRPFESDRIQDRYQYDGDIFGIGLNCSAERVDSDPVTTVRTRAVPVYRQSKYVSRDTIDAPFDRLAEGELSSVLGHIASEMERAHGQYREVEEEVLAGKSAQAEESFHEMLDQFAEEHERFSQGRAILEDEDNERIRTAFMALNRTFARMGPGYTDWRLFQIVYIVMSIPDIVAQAGSALDIDAALDTCDVIFFPTGGGKTEAYLGLVVFTAFHDRLRGKTYGMTALTKFPLRLLSLQQLQRIANVLCQAESIRREQEMGGEPFSIGYFVGNNNTPNNMFESGDSREVTNNAELARESDEHQQQWLTVPECPYCNEEQVEVTGDTDRLRIIHRCTNTGGPGVDPCPEVERQGGEHAELPIYITDNEVYRYAPTFVVSTIDKIAVVGSNRRFRGLLGQMKHECPDHGYTAEDRCLLSNSYLPEEDSCDRGRPADLISVEPTDPPSILIQDELHLLREEFGAFDSHYETFIQELIRRYTDGAWEMKVIAATATIKGASKQVRALYRKEPNEFPSRGPRLKQSFYAYEEPHRLGRQMVGAIPRSINRTQAMNIVIREYARIVQRYQADPRSLIEAIEEQAAPTIAGGLEMPSDPERQEELLRDVLDDYDTQVAYNISKNQSDILQRSVRGMINRQLDAFGEDYHRLVPVSMTGETEMESVRDVLSRLEADEPVDPIDVVIATSMISHGVDIDQLNFMSFFGMPRNTAEYIQAYSRVGRRHPGTVFLLFDAIRARDRSHYSRSEHYHRYQDLLVEATPLERWAEFAIECTLPGIVVGTVLQYYHGEYQDQLEDSIYQIDGFREAMKKGIIEREQLLEDVLRAYDVKDGDTSEASIGEKVYRERIHSRFDEVWHRLKNKQPQTVNPREIGLAKFIGNIIEGDADDQRGPMRSLRDVDEQVTVGFDQTTEDLLEMFGQVTSE